MKRKGLMLLYLLLPTASIINAQVISVNKLHPVLQQEYIKLKNHHIDTILTYYQYCIGCEAIDKSDGCSNFINSYILWKDKGNFYAKEVICNKNNTSEAVLITSKPFEYFFVNLPKFRQKEEYKFNADNIFPLPSHTIYEEVTLLTSQIRYQVYLAKEQKTEKSWQAYEWIKATSELIELTKNEIQKK